MATTDRQLIEPERLPPLNALRCFQAVARDGSFAAAATSLHVTHWAVGKQIRLLEDWFGVALFERRARGVTLTDEGGALLNDVSAAFERLSGAASRLRKDGFKRRVAGVVRINVLTSFAISWLVPRLADFQLRYPDIDLRLSTSSRRLRYIADAFDVGVRTGYEQAAGVVSHTLMADRRVPACNPSLLRQHPVETADDLRHHTLLHSATTRTAWSQWLREAGATGLRPARSVEFDHTHVQLAAAVEGVGVALLSLPLIERDIAAGRLVCPLPTPMLLADDYSLLINQDRVEDEAVSAFVVWITTTAGGNTKKTSKKGVTRHLKSGIIL